VAILAAVASNTAAKVAIGAAIGRGRFAIEIAAMALACLLVGSVALWLTLSTSPERCDISADLGQDSNAFVSRLLGILLALTRFSSCGWKLVQCAQRTPRI